MPHLFFHPDHSLPFRLLAILRTTSYIHAPSQHISGSCLCRSSLSVNFLALFLLVEERVLCATCLSFVFRADYQSLLRLRSSLLTVTHATNTISCRRCLCTVHCEFYLRFYLRLLLHRGRLIPAGRIVSVVRGLEPAAHRPRVFSVGRSAVFCLVHWSCYVLGVASVCCLARLLSCSCCLLDIVTTIGAVSTVLCDFRFFNLVIIILITMTTTMMIIIIVLLGAIPTESTQPFRQENSLNIKSRKPNDSRVLYMMQSND